jgi:hypothetical protein
MFISGDCYMAFVAGPDGPSSDACPSGFVQLAVAAPPAGQDGEYVLGQCSELVSS